ncbi:MAG: hypothetical protein NVSMB48_15470 [Marmoricola sp.]
MGKHRDETGSSRAQAPGSGQERPPVGTLAEEASQLFAVLSGLARDQAAQYTAGAESMTSSATAAVRAVNEHIATGDAECTYCPICRVIHVARTASPEVKAHLSSAILSLAQAASAVMAPPSAEPASSDRAEESAEGAPADGSLHKIDLDAGAWDQE